MKRYPVGVELKVTLGVVIRRVSYKKRKLYYGAARFLALKSEGLSHIRADHSVSTIIAMQVFDAADS